MRRALRALRQRWRAARRAATPLPRPATPPRRPLDLALVIPVWNDAAGLARLLDQARGMECFAQIVVVDDGSDDPVDPGPGVTLLRHPRSLGGGVARNAGLARVICTHVLFFDADDRLTPELPLLLADLADQPPFDFCLFKHADSRVAAEPRWGQPDWDELFWQRAGHAVGALAEAGPAACAQLVQTANYPWNKIYRTLFLRDHGIGCAETRVHQDIPLHWLGFLAAGRVLVSDRICAWHHVAAEGSRLTNLRGAERLQVFDALTPVARAAAGAPPAMQAALAAFVPGLLDWIETRIEPALIPDLRAAEAAWRAEHMPETAMLEPVLAAGARE